MGSVPNTSEVNRTLNFTLPRNSTAQRTLTGRWMLLAWRSIPGDPSYRAEAHVNVDGLIVFSDLDFEMDQYMVGPSKSRTEPRGDESIPRFVISEEFITMSGESSNSDNFQTEFLAIQLDYSAPVEYE